MKTNFLKFGMMFLIVASSLTSCTKEDLVEPDLNSNNTNVKTVDSVSIVKNMLDTKLNPEKFLGEWKLTHAYYNNVDHFGDSAIFMFYNLYLLVDPSQFGYTPAKIKRVQDINVERTYEFEHWEYKNNNLYFYLSYSDVVNNYSNIIEPFTIYNARIENDILKCQVIRILSRGMKYDCEYVKTKDY